MAALARGDTTFSPRGGYFRWSTRDLDGDHIRRYDQATINLIKARLKTVMHDVSNRAKSKEYAGWNDHPERHPSRHWPGPQTARQQMFAFVTGGQPGRQITLGLTHGPETIYANAAGGSTFNYGIALEQKFGTVSRTLEDSQGEFMAACEGALNDHHGWEGDEQT